VVARHENDRIIRVVEHLEGGVEDGVVVGHVPGAQEHVEVLRAPL